MVENNSSQSNITFKSVLDLERDNLTPGMKQYQEVKKLHPDCVVMLRMGDFYEMFYQDAVTASRELEITLTSRGKGDKQAPLAGVPFHALETYLGRLVKKGYKVAIVEQLEDPKLAKGLVKRGLVRIVTPGTVIESSLLNEKENNYVMAITSYAENFAIACCDLSTGEFTTSLLESESLLLNELSRLNPSECIIPESLKVNLELVTKIKNLGSVITAKEDYFFKLEIAEKELLQHFQIKSLASMGLEEKKLNISVCGALLKYLHDTQKNMLSHLKNISLRSLNQKMLLDTSTIRNLELLKNIKDGSSRGTLLSVLDKTSTPLGARLLRKWLKEPLLNKNSIEQRLQAVQELNSQPMSREEIQELLKEVYDLERLISRINYGNANPRDLLSLRNSLLQLPKIKEKLAEFSGAMLSSLSQINSLDEIAILLHHSLKEEAPLVLREGNIIKEGFNQELDQVREIKKNSRSYLQQLEEQEKKKTGISTLHLGYTKVFGYFIEVTKKNIPLIPANYIRKQTTANSERYITEELKVEEEKILGAEEKINALEYELFMDLLKTIAKETILIQETAQKIAVLDTLISFSLVACENNYVMPELQEQRILEIHNGRHPVVEKMVPQFIPNDIFLLPGEMMIITGPNMAGKSTIMRQTALIALMAQIGCFVPADKAMMGIVDCVFTRVGAYDDLSSGQSTFLVEMNETASILHNATENSLIILDEIGRGTSTFDGVSIAWSVAEHIYNKIRARTLFATHYHVLNKLADKFTKIKNFNVAVKEVKGEIILLHKLVQGGTDQSHGIHVAKLAGLPLEVIERAKEIQALLEKDDDMMRKIKAKKLEEQTGLDRF